MANTPSAEKRIRRNARREAINKSRKSRIRTFVKKVEAAIDSGVRADAERAFLAAQPEMMRGVTRGVLHRNAVARKLSRLSARIARLPHA